MTSYSVLYKFIGAIVFCFIWMMPGKAYSQDSLLTIQSAIEMALTTNYDIQIARNREMQDANNNTAGNAGMLPNLSANAAYTRSVNSVDQKYNNGNEVKRDGSTASLTNADAGVVWTIFDGMKMFSTREKLGQISRQSQEMMKVQMENTIMEVVSSYYGIVRQVQLKKAMEEEIRFSSERITVAERKLSNGSGSMLELLQAKTERNRQVSLQMKIESDLEAFRTELNRLLGRKIETPFTVEDTVVMDYNPKPEELSKTVFENNHLLNYYKRSRRIAELGLHETRAARLPIVNVNAHYSYTKNNSEAGFILLNRTNGFNYGASVTLPLFRGLTINNQVKNARLDLASAELELQSTQSDLSAGLSNATREHKNNLDILKLEEENIISAREVFSIARERFRVGISSNVELLDAQRTFEEAMSRLAEARYNAKISETLLKKINAELVK